MRQSTTATADRAASWSSRGHDLRIGSQQAAHVQCYFHVTPSDPNGTFATPLLHPPNGFHSEGTRLNYGNWAGAVKVGARVGTSQPRLRKFIG